MQTEFNPDTELLELDLLLTCIYKQYHYDFRNYAKASLLRRVKDFAQLLKLQKISELMPLVLYNNDVFEQLIRSLSITVTEMFRDPFVYKYIRGSITNVLKTYPHVKIWHAGCATGEEVYSLAILLHEEGLLERARIYATDFNNEALVTAKEGIFPLKKFKLYSNNYSEAGGKSTLSDYFHTKYDSVMMHRFLKENITFANHNLITDQVFGEMHLIFCRNVLIYFDRTLQNRVLKLFFESLVSKGYLVLGTKESLKFSELESDFVLLGTKEKIYQKKFQLDSV